MGIARQAEPVTGPGTGDGRVPPEAAGDGDSPHTPTPPYD